MTSSDTRRFHLGDVLSVMTGLMLSPRGVQGVHELLDHMTGDTLLTHQLPRAIGECAPYLRRRFPDLASVEVPEEFPEPREVTVPAWLSDQVSQFGEWADVKPIPAGAHTHINPLTELRMKAPHLDVIVVETPNGGGGTSHA